MKTLHRFVSVPFLSMVVCLAFVAPAAAQSVITLKLAGIEGESQLKGHAGEIDVLSVSYGIATATSSAAVGGGAVGRPSCSGLHVSTFIGVEAPQLFLKTATGETMSEGTLYFLRNTGDSLTTAFTLNIRNVVAKSLNHGGSAGGGDAIQSFSLDFASATLQIYDEQGRVEAAGTFDCVPTSGR